MAVTSAVLLVTVVKGFVEQAHHIFIEFQILLPFSVLLFILKVEKQHPVPYNIKLFTIVMEQHILDTNER